MTALLTRAGFGLASLSTLISELVVEIERQNEIIADLEAMDVKCVAELQSLAGEIDRLRAELANGETK